MSFIAYQCSNQVLHVWFVCNILTETNRITAHFSWNIMIKIDLNVKIKVVVWTCSLCDVNEWAIVVYSTQWLNN